MTDKLNMTNIDEAAYLLRSGEIVAFPTETGYGRGADATNERAVKKIFKAKGRPADNPLIVHVATTEQVANLVEQIPSYVELLMEHFSHGPIRYVSKSNGQVASAVTGGLDTVGVRIPNHPVALLLLQACNIPLAAPCVNVSGNPRPT